MTVLAPAEIWAILQLVQMVVQWARFQAKLPWREGSTIEKYITMFKIKLSNFLIKNYEI